MQSRYLQFYCLSPLSPPFALTMLLDLCISTLFAGLALAQYPSEPEDLEVVTSELNPDVTITYKQVVSGAIIQAPALLM
jgi:hypothetical protein